MFEPKVRLDKSLYERVAKCAERAGYASAEEFIVHVLEREVAALEPATEGQDDPRVEERLRGLGYIE